MNLAHGLTVDGVDTRLSNMNKENLKRLYIQKRVRRALLARKGIIADSAIIGLPFRGGIEDFIEKSDTSGSNNLSKLLALETALEYLVKAESGKREYLSPGEKAPEGLKEYPGSRPGVRYYVDLELGIMYLESHNQNKNSLLCTPYLLQNFL